MTDANRTPTDVAPEEWERRYKARIVERCMASAQSEDVDRAFLDEEWEPWTREQAESAANAEFEAVEFHEIYDGYENDPEGSADESMSAWSDGV